MKTLKYLSLFSGIGGFEYGLEQSKYEFQSIGASEINEYAKSIYFRHFPRHKDLGDASKIDTKELQDFELLVAGFPCQAFSIAGKREGFDDTRGTLFFEIARILKEKRPRYFLLENVKGILSHDGGRTFKKILGVLSELGYDVEWETLNSKSFSVPQNRERVYFKGYFRGKCGGEILSQKRDCGEISSELNKSKIQKVGNLSNTGHGGKNVYSSEGLSPTLCTDSIPKNGVNIVELKPFTFNRQVKKRVHKANYAELSEFLRSHKKNAKMTSNKISDALGVKKSEVDHWFRTDKFFSPPSAEIWYDLKELLLIEDDRYDAFITEYELVDGVYEMDKRAYDVEGISSTVTTTDENLIKVNIVGNVSNTGHHGDDIFGLDGVSPSLTSTDWKHPIKIKKEDKGDAYRIRRLTPVECDRLQGFPDGWTKFGKDGEMISDTQRYRCLGNAVTTTVVTYIANTMFGGYFGE